MAPTYRSTMERVLYNLHHKLCTIALQRSSTKGRRLAERFLFTSFVSGFTITLIMHVLFVHRDTTTIAGRPLQSIPLTCLESIRGFSADADVTHITILQEGSNVASWASRPNPPATDMCPMESEKIFFSYSRVQGYLLLSPELCARHNLTVQHVMVSRHDERCFGRPLLQKVVFWITGPDTIVTNWLLGTFNTTGYIYKPTSKLMLDLAQYSQMDNGVVSSHRLWYHQVISKGAVVFKTCFLFFIVTTLVAFILRETQERMLEFTHQLQARVRLRRPVTYLVIAHVVENLVFVPIMVGMIFFLIEIYRGDKVTAFMVLSIVWICEAFSAISLRSSEGMHFFPRIFFLEYSMFHFYLFIFPFGFIYLALASSTLCILYSMLFFWHRYELPAVAHGHVTIDNPRLGRSPGRNVQSTDTSRSNSISRSNSAARFPNVQLPPQRSFSRQSFSSLQRLFHPGYDSDGDTSYMFFMDGELVVHNDRRSPVLRQDSADESSSSLDRRIPDNIAAVANVDAPEEDELLENPPRNQRRTVRLVSADAMVEPDVMAGTPVISNQADGTIYNDFRREEMRFPTFPDINESR